MTRNQNIISRIKSMSAPKFGKDGPKGIDDAAERMNSAARDKVDNMQEDAQSMASDMPKTPEEFLEDERFRAPEARKMMEEKTKESKKKKGKEPEKFEVDLDAYTEFVDKVTSDPSKDFNTLIARYRELHDAGCKIERLDTAASGMSAEAGEFMEIVKKLKFQGKPYDEKTKEHLQKELGDVMWYVAQAAMALGVRLDEVIYLNTLKLAARYPEGLFEVERSENRKAGDI